MFECNFCTVSFLLLASAVVAASDQAGTTTTLFDADGDGGHDSMEASGDSIFLLPREAKSVLKVRRWGVWSIKDLWRDGREEETEYRERRSEQRWKLCQKDCWGPWTYTPCTVQCGSSGTKTRTRVKKTPSSLCKSFIATYGCPGRSEENGDLWISWKSKQWTGLYLPIPNTMGGRVSSLLF
ncbi:hypothetical protein CAPTEDRAFT_189565 [Capitella teleta]|uniref:Uncharacterized protein n=1 Tax=Capitella teleta TaxID=283909 RepID=R7UI00_CAPTE|nr:hypothetical protein CAPTEDRAFT_189565 [Capitella teleta]|eukprot:ELU05718.1 hypothetical protein CAPTEDRAFT_189565 [Capitella teleta]